MRTDKDGINIYDNLVKNPNKYSEINERTEFRFDNGAIVEFKSSIPDNVCKIKMIEADTGKMHYETEITTGMFAKSNRKEISSLLINATDKFGKELLNVDLKNWAQKKGLI